MNNRLKPVVGLAIAASTPRAVFAQVKKPPVVIGWYRAGSREGNPRLFAMFKEEFAALGWKKGVRFVVEERVADVRGSGRMAERA